MDIDGDHVILTSGRRFYAHAGILGMDDDLDLSGGYDDLISFDDDEEALSKTERLEIAAYMIDLWQRWSKQG